MISDKLDSETIDAYIADVLAIFSYLKHANQGEFCSMGMTYAREQLCYQTVDIGNLIIKITFDNDFRN